jgi:hypothetical protein
MEHFNIPGATTSSDGKHVTYPVPVGPLPPSQMLAFVRAEATDPNRIDHATLVIPREKVAKYTAWLAESGGSDRDATPEELDVIMKIAGSILAEFQLEAFSRIGEAVIGMLGDGDSDAATLRIAESFAGRAARKAISEGASVEEAQARAASLVDEVRRLVNDENSEGGAA